MTAVVSAQLLKCLSPPCEMGGASEKEVRVQLRVGGDAPLPAALPFTYRATKGGGARPLASTRRTLRCRPPTSTSPRSSGAWSASSRPPPIVWVAAQAALAAA